MLTFLLLALACMRPLPVECPRGCILHGGWSYEITAEDAVWLARALACEVGTHARSEEGPATAWALVQRFARVHHRHSTFGGFLRSYCQCVSAEWGTGGTRRSSLSTPERVDAARSIPWYEIDFAVLDLAARFMRCGVANLTPGYVHFIADGLQEWACASCVDPLVFGEPPRRNAYFKETGTLRWTARTVRLRCGR